MTTTTNTDTIAAIATAAGVGSIAIVRVSGKDALEYAQKLTKKTDFRPRLATLASLYDSDGALIDEAIVIYFQAPRSFTAEDVVEFQCHGGVVVADTILKELLHLGARLANPGEFSKRAFLNGRIDLSEAEAIAKLIEAKSQDAAKILARQVKGELRRYIEEVRTQIIRLMAYSEVNIDYAEEDLPEDLSQMMRQELQTLQNSLEKTLQASKARAGLMQGFRVAIIGKPNVGKSSLLNALLRYDRAIVSDIAGTTRDTIEEEIRIGSHLVRIVDTAGIRQASDAVERIGIDRTIEAIEQSEIVIALFDGSRQADEEDKKIVAILEEQARQKHKIFVKTKVDLVQRFDLTIDFDCEICVKEDVSCLLNRLEKILDQVNDGEEVMLISRRQIEAIAATIDAIEASTQPLEDGELEIFSFWLTQAIKSLESITRPYDVDETLDAMFQSFCLGK